MSRNTASPHYDRECLYAPLRRADEVPTHAKTEELAELHDATFWRGCKAALVGGLPQCRGSSCNGGRSPCTDRCGSEMAAPQAAPEADPAPSMWRVVLAYLMGKDPF